MVLTDENWEKIIELFLSIGLDEKTARQTINNKKVTSDLTAVIHEVCFIVGGQRLYSGSVVKTIKVWDLDTLQCMMTLRQHNDTVTSLLCWDQYLISSSLDGTIKVWASSESANLTVIHTRSKEQSVHALCGLHDAEAKPIIFCSYENGTVSIYDLPSFEERGRMFSTHTIGRLTNGPQGLLFSGDKNGKVRVWTLGPNKV